MKKTRRILALALAMILVMAMGISASATNYGTTNEHTITIKNSDANGNHSYEGYQVFKGNLNAEENLLSDIEWGVGVDGAGILEDLIAANADNDSPLNGKFAGLTEGDSTVDPAVPASTATDVAKAIAGLGDNSAELDAVARIINDHLTTTKYAFSGPAEGKYTATVPNDGYYFIKDTTAREDLPDGDTISKFMLSVVKDVTIEAKDTSVSPDKEILGGPTNVKEGTAAIGDPVQFQVAIPVPDTTTFKKDFWFVMDDTLPAGLTFMQVDSVKTYAAADIDTANGYKITPGATATATLSTPPANETSVGYTVTVDTGSGSYGAYTKPADNDAAVTAAGGQKIKVTFNEFKKFAETEYATDTNHIGEYVVITYTAVVNDDAVYGATGNKNEVEFKFSNDPNHDYDGDDINENEPVGTTPKDETKTLVTTIEILKVIGGTTNPLAGAEFEITGTAYNTTLVTAEKFTLDENGTYWLLKDGSYTATDPDTVTNKTQYAEPLTNKYKLETVTNVVTKPENTKLTLISDAEGKIDIKGLKPGTYTIKETKAPDGYNKIDTVFTIVVAWENPGEDETLTTSGGFSIGQGSTETVTMSADGSQYKIQIDNYAGTTLPSTGGIGTTMFYLIGAVLVIGAGVLLVTRRRMNAR